jgi:nitrite reductase/ring-hydroxylating ferredoxin subunit
MALVRCMTEMGMGVDVHGLDDTLAAKRTVFDALHHSSLGFARLVGATAMEDASRHAGASLRGGALRGTIVRCPAHGWRYDVCTGQTLNEPDDGVASFPVQVVDGTILVALV